MSQDPDPDDAQDRLGFGRGWAWRCTGVARVGAASRVLVSMRARTAVESGGTASVNADLRRSARRALLTHPNHRRRVALPFPRLLFIRFIIVLIVLDGSGAVFACRNHPVAFFLLPHRQPAQPCAHIPPFHRIHRCHTGLRRLRVGIAHTCRCPLARFPPGYGKRVYRYWGLSLCLLRRLCLRRS